ncbi:MAG TPA: efflux RND transporter periplasmic adaptor subunit [Gemmatimonadaceae bacterium]|nr:efflux RND transporter periplasmic adaptor subunit [Gemmatimonadaceae bacterium]
MSAQLSEHDADRTAPRFGITGRSWLRSGLLVATIVVIGGALAAWKTSAIHASEAAAANQPEPMELVTAAVATDREYRETMTAIGTVLALRSVSLRNEVSGTVSRVNLTPGQIVEAGTVLVALDVSVERAELEALEAQAALAQTVLGRQERLIAERASTQAAVDRARAERDVALAQIERVKAIIARKTIRAPFRARIGISDVHPGQYLNEGTVLTTLQGVDESANIDFAVPQRVAASLRVGDEVAAVDREEAAPIAARVAAIDSRIDPTTRNAVVRARVRGAGTRLAPGASVRVVVPSGPAQNVVVIPASALRKGPAGDHVFVIQADADGRDRVSTRPVRSGALIGDEVVVLEGLEPGERVAASGSFKLRESLLVAVAADSANTAKGGN